MARRKRGHPGPSSAGAEEDLLEVEVVGLDGENRVAIKVNERIYGSELRKIISDQLPFKAGGRVSLQNGSQIISFNKRLREQGLLANRRGKRSLSYLYVPASLADAGRDLLELLVDEDFPPLGQPVPRVRPELLFDRQFSLLWRASPRSKDLDFGVFGR